MSSAEIQFPNFLQQQIPGVIVQEQTPRSADIVQQVLAFSAYFDLLWSALKSWIDLRTDSTIGITYVSVDGRTIDARMNRLTRAEVEQFLRDNPPKPETGVRLIVT